MRSVSDRQFGEPSELESFFLHCIDKVKAEIAERRQNTAEYNKRLAAPSRKKGSGADNSNTALARTGPSAEVSIDDFTVVDRRKVIELLLSSEQVLQFLYNKLFPGAQTSQEGI